MKRSRCTRPVERRNLARGISLVELALSLGVILALAGVLLNRLAYYQEAAEKAQMEYTVNTLKLAPQLRIGHDLGRQRPVDFAAIAGENPVTWLDRPMPGYRGEVGAAEAQALEPGSWCFARAERELVYRPLRSDHLADDSTGQKRVRFKVALVRAVNGAGTNDGSVIGLQLRPVERYRWL